MRKALLTIVIFTFSIFIVSCSQTEPSGNVDTVEFDETDFELLITPNNNLAFKLLEHVEPNNDQNIFVSPTSLLMALSMVYNGAEAEAKDEIAKALQLPAINKIDLNRANASLISKLTKQSDDVQLHIANSIWLNDEFHFQDQFASDNKDYFDAEINEIDIRDPESAKLINDWVKEKTNEKIDKIIDPPLNPNLVTILLNALYFKGNWTHEFDETLTEDQAFTLSDGETVHIPLMTLNEKLPYFENDVFQAVSLPYGDDEMSMDIYLPKEDMKLEAFIDELTGENWESWKQQFEENEGTILLPKFEIEYEAVLNDALKTLGMDTVFTEDANFSKMIVEDDPVWISKVRQKTYIDVHEKGTEAAAVTSVEVETLALIDEEPFHMEVNRPFFFVIKDTETNMILFTGLIENPAKK